MQKAAENLVNQYPKYLQNEDFTPTLAKLGKSKTMDNKLVLSISLWFCEPQYVTLRTFLKFDLYEQGNYS